MGPGETQYGPQRRDCLGRTYEGGRKKSIPKLRLSVPNRRCEHAQTTYSKEAKRQSAEQLGKEQAWRLNTQRTEDEDQCVNEAKLLRHGKCHEDQQGTK